MRFRSVFIVDGERPPRNTRPHEQTSHASELCGFTFPARDYARSTGADRPGNREGRNGGARIKAYAAAGSEGTSNPQARGSQNSADKKQSFNVRNAEDERAAGDP